MMLKGMTVQYLIRRTYKVQPGETVLFHAAAGGVGLIACQWLKALGVHGDRHRRLRREGRARQGTRLRAYDRLAPRELRRARARRSPAAKGVPVVYDSVGKDTFMGSLDCLQPLG